jgi:hypothetical protein
MNKEITTIETIGHLVPTDVFKEGGIKPILDAIEREIASVVPDTETDKGRKAIASNAFKVSQSKTALDNMGKKLAADLNSKLKPINAERKLARDTLDALRDKTRLPLTVWEEAEVAKKSAEAARIILIKLQEQVENDHEIGLLLNEKIDRDLAEANAKAEKERIEAEEIERKEQAERDDRIAREAAEAEKNRQEEIIKAAEREKIEAEARLKAQEAEAERQRLAAIERAEKDKQAAIEKAEQDKQAAIKAEQDRVAAGKRRDQIELERREADKKHRRKINNEALAAFKKGGLDAKSAKLAVELIAKKMIANVSISY